MTRLVVVRPEPGNARTVAAATAAGFEAEAMPLFAVRPLPWTPPDPSRFDALLLTSANAARHGGGGLDALASLPVLAVGEATAAAAERAGFDVAMVGTADGAALVAEAGARGYRRLLHLAGRERTPLPVDAVIAVYASDPLGPSADFHVRTIGATVLLHSARAARRVAEMIEDRTHVAVAAISAPVLAAAGDGWRAAVAAPPLPTPRCSPPRRRSPIDRAGDGGDKRRVATAYDPRPRRRGGYWLGALLVVIAFVGGAGGAWWTLRSRQPATPPPAVPARG